MPVAKPVDNSKSLAMSTHFDSSESLAVSAKHLLWSEPVP